MPDSNDPFEALRGNFQVTPPDAIEIRRRGDRRRRRTTTLVPVGAAAAAILAIAIPLAVVSGHDDNNVPVATTTPSPTPTPSPSSSPTETSGGDAQRNGDGWLVLIPADFPLARGLGASSSGAPVVEPGAGPNPSITCRGPEIFSPQDTAIAAAHVSSTDAGDYGENRQLYLYPDGTSAQADLQAVRTLARRCALEQEYAASIFMLDAGSDPDAVAFGFASSGGEFAAYVISNVGNAILVEEAVGAGGASGLSKSDLQHLVDTLLAESRRVHAAMGVFAEPAGSAPPTQTQTQTQTPTATGTLGPAGYRSLELGMSYSDAMATGLLVKADPQVSALEWAIKSHPKSAVCLSKADGLMAIFGDETMATPEGIHLGSTLEEVKAAYPGLKETINNYYVELTPTTRYQFLVQPGDTVYQWDLTTTNESCFG